MRKGNHKFFQDIDLDKALYESFRRAGKSEMLINYLKRIGKKK